MVGHHSGRPAAKFLQPDMTRPELVRISLSLHRKMRLRPTSDYSFAGRLVLTDIVAAELGQAATCFPLAFAPRGGTIHLVALLSLTPERNLFVSTGGTWLTDFVPASVCTYPFQYHPEGDSGRAVLLADRNSGQLNETEGEPLFTEAGKPSEKTKEIVRILRMYEKSRKATQKACLQLQRYKLLVPWGRDCEAESLRSLLRVDEAVLNSLPQGVFSVLRQAGALPIIYAQLLSTALLPRLANLGQLHAAADDKRQELLRSCFRVEDDIMDSFQL